MTRNARQARQRRHEAARARQAARRRRDRRRLGLAAALAVLLVVGIGGLAVSVAGRSGLAATGTGALPGLQTGRRPGAPTPPTRPPACAPSACPPCTLSKAPSCTSTSTLTCTSTAVRCRCRRASASIPPWGSPRCTPHDASGVIHVESPTVRTYAGGSSSPCGRVRFTPSCLGGYCAAGDRRLRVHVNGRHLSGRPHHAAPGVPSGARGRLRHGLPPALPDPVHLPVPLRPLAPRRPYRRGWAGRPVWVSLDR